MLGEQQPYPFAMNNPEEETRKLAIGVTHPKEVLKGNPGFTLRCKKKLSSISQSVPRQ